MITVFRLALLATLLALSVPLRLGSGTPGPVEASDAPGVARAGSGSEEESEQIVAAADEVDEDDGDGIADDALAPLLTAKDVALRSRRVMPVPPSGLTAARGVTDLVFRPPRHPG